ncbi:sensor histidine kinase [Reinekea marinisedimentorum]|nr:ATP-binding protein [Reinekea marinisedimentorum]
MNQHLARRLMVYIASSVLAALMLSVAIQYMALQKVFERTRVSNIEAAIENLVDIVSQSLWVFNEEAATEAADAILRDPYISGVALNDHSALFSYRNGDLTNTDIINPKIRDIVQIEEQDSLIYIIPLIVESQNSSQELFNIGTLQIVSDNQLVKQPVEQLTKLTLSATFLIIVMLQMLFYLMIRNTIAKPLEMFTEHVHKLATSLSSEVQAENRLLANREDEIGRLYNVFNQQRLELVERDRNLTEYRFELEQTVLERTSELRTSNANLQDSLDQLRKAQQELIQNEKMASLGTLVSGIAHEVNTPLGIAITAASHLKEELRITSKALDDNTLTKSGFENFVKGSLETESLLTNNLHRAASLIKSFKLVAVDQSSEEQRNINLRAYINEVLLSLRPRIKSTQIRVHNDIPDDIQMNVAPGSLAQIYTNLIMNSITHGYDGGHKPGDIHLQAEIRNNRLILLYSDDGAGMDEITLRKIYDPFYTTRRSDGGSGLGMNIVYNLVTSKLNGNIETKSQPGQGIQVRMSLKISENVSNTQEQLDD